MTQLVADVFDALLMDTKTGDVYATTTLTEANIDVTMDSNDVRAGRGNQLLGVLHSNRDINITLTEAQVNYDMIAMQFGTDVKTGAGIAYAAPKWYEVADNAGTNEITLENTPLSEDHDMKIFNADGQAITGFTVSGDAIDLTGATPAVTAGEEVEVRTYKYATPEGTESVEFDIEKLPASVKLVLETIEINGEEEITHKLQYQFDKTILDGAFTINTTSERNASTQAINLRVLKPKTSSKVGRLLRIPLEPAS